MTDYVPAHPHEGRTVAAYTNRRGRLFKTIHRRRFHLDHLQPIGKISLQVGRLSTDSPTASRHSLSPFTKCFHPDVNDYAPGEDARTQLISAERWAAGRQWEEMLGWSYPAGYLPKPRWVSGGSVAASSFAAARCTNICYSELPNISSTRGRLISVHPMQMVSNNDS